MIRLYFTLATATGPLCERVLYFPNPWEGLGNLASLSLSYEWGAFEFMTAG